MGLFDKFIKRKSNTGNFIPTSELEAAFAILYAVSASDGDASEIETDRIMRRLMLKRRYFGLSWDGIIKNVLYANSNLGGSALIKASCPLIPDDFRPTIFSIAVETMFADGDFMDEEMEIIEYVAQEMNLSDELSQSIVKVITIMSEENIPYESI